jgi:predicted RNA-binding protein YlqC (UPF0109 family)
MSSSEEELAEAGPSADIDEDFDPDLDDDFNRVTGGISKAVLEYLARQIVDEPAGVVIEVEQARRGLRLALHVAPEDMGKVIGRRGRVAQAIRTVVRAAGASEGVEVSVDIID